MRRKKRREREREGGGGEGGRAPPSHLHLCSGSSLKQSPVPHKVVVVEEVVVDALPTMLGVLSSFFFFSFLFFLLSNPSPSLFLPFLLMFLSHLPLLHRKGGRIGTSLNPPPFFEGHLTPVLWTATVCHPVEHWKHSTLLGQLGFHPLYVCHPPPPPTPP
eukprot:Sspe_Gene.106326::Locus_83867_Transcript_1_1_Confidence_1.000_Length_478::g.106326::m.106326